MDQKEFEQFKARLKERFKEKEQSRNIWYLIGCITSNAGSGKEERTYTETQLSEPFDLV